MEELRQNPLAKRIWDNYHEIGEVQKSNKIKFIVAAGVRDGVRYINIREFYLRSKDNTWMPAKDGITIPLAHPIKEGTVIIHPYKDMMELILKAAEVLVDLPLFDMEHSVFYLPKPKEDAVVKLTKYKVVEE